MTDSPRFQAMHTREQFSEARILSERTIVRYAYRPFDLRWLYWEPRTKLIDEKRAEYLPHIVFRQSLSGSRAAEPKRVSTRHYLSQALCCLHIIEQRANMFPLLLREWSKKAVSLPDEARALSTGDRRPLRQPLRSPLCSTSIASVPSTTPPHLFHHAAAVLHAPAYAEENAGGLAQDWPRIPLPASRDALLASAALGRQVAALLDTETPVDRVTAGKPRPELKVHRRRRPGRRRQSDGGGAGGDGPLGRGRQGRRLYARQGQAERPRLHRRTNARPSAKGRPPWAWTRPRPWPAWAKRPLTSTSTTRPTGGTCRRGCGRTRWAAIRW